MNRGGEGGEPVQAVNCTQGGRLWGRTGALWDLKAAGTVDLLLQCTLGSAARTHKKAEINSPCEGKEIKNAVIVAEKNLQRVERLTLKQLFPHAEPVCLTVFVQQWESVVVKSTVIAMIVHHRARSMQEMTGDDCLFSIRTSFDFLLGRISPGDTKC